MRYAVYEDEATKERFVDEVPNDIAPIHISYDDGTVGERVSLPFEADSIEDAARKASHYCFA